MLKGLNLVPFMGVLTYSDNELTLSDTGENR